MENSPLSRLPAELRNNIWERVLLSCIEILVSDKSYKQWRPPALLRSCRELRREASGLYYAGNTFPLKCRDIFCVLNKFLGSERGSVGCAKHVDMLLLSWLSVLSASSRAHLRSVHLKDCRNTVKEGETRLAQRWEYLESLGLGLNEAALWVGASFAS